MSRFSVTWTSAMFATELVPSINKKPKLLERISSMLTSSYIYPSKSFHGCRSTPEHDTSNSTMSTNLSLATISFLYSDIICFENIKFPIIIFPDGVENNSSNGFDYLGSCLTKWTD